MLVYLDACIIIYWVEGPAPFDARVRIHIATLSAAGHNFAVSEFTRLECLVKPLGARRFGRLGANPPVAKTGERNACTAFAESAVVAVAQLKLPPSSAPDAPNWAGRPGRRNSPIFHSHSNL